MLDDERARGRVGGGGARGGGRRAGRAGVCDLGAVRGAVAPQAPVGPERRRRRRAFSRVEGAALARRAVEEKGHPGAANAHNAATRRPSRSSASRGTRWASSNRRGRGAVDLDAGLAEQATKNLVLVSAALVAAEMMTTDDENALRGGGDEKSLDASDGGVPPRVRLCLGCFGAWGRCARGRSSNTAPLRRCARPRRWRRRSLRRVRVASRAAIRIIRSFECAPELLPRRSCGPRCSRGREHGGRRGGAQGSGDRSSGGFARRAMPPEAFTPATCRARRIDAARNESSSARERATDVERAARAKIGKAGKRKEARKRKVQAFARGRARASRASESEARVRGLSARPAKIGVAAGVFGDGGRVAVELQPGA